VESTHPDEDSRAHGTACADLDAETRRDGIATAYLDAILSGDLDALAASDCAEWRLHAELRLHPVRPDRAPPAGTADLLRRRDSVHDRDSAGLGRDPVPASEGS
jgi:hypothetical protein